MSGINRYYYLDKKRRGRSVANEASLGDVLSLLLKKYHIDYNLYDDKVIALFKECVGVVIEKFIEKIYVSKNVLYVKVSLPSVRAELFMVRDAMKDTINRKLGKNFLKNIIIK